MRRERIIRILALMAILAHWVGGRIAYSAETSPTTTQAATTAPSKDKEDSGGAVKGTVESASTSKHEITIGGEAISYQATAASMLMKDEAGKIKARVFFVAYEKDHAADADRSERPITFVFNGGPGAAAVWLHLGAAGPRRIDLAEDGEPPAPPYRLVENNHSWLDATDLVFIDPVGTGFSRPAEGEKGEQFYGVQEDIRWVADFIRLYTTQYQRWLSPKFLAGESYGTTRAAGLSEYLLDELGVALNGIVLISSVLHFQTLSPGDSNDLPYPLFLPTYTAAAWYHKRLADDLQADLNGALEEVEPWAIGEYATALAKGDALGPQEREKIIGRLVRYTALPRELIDRSNLRIDPGVFEKYLLADQHKLIGRFDARITGFDPEPISNRPAYDPSLSRYLPVYSSTFNDYVRRVLKYESVLPYEVLSDKVRPWKYPESGHGYLSVADNLRSAMVKNPHLKVLFCSGYFDLATPYFATDYTIEHLELAPELRGHITQTYYHGGHMMYHQRKSLEKLHAEVVKFVRSASPPK